MSGPPSGYGSVPSREDDGARKRDRGVELPMDDGRPTCRNPIFAALFVAHLVGVGFLGRAYGSFGIADEMEALHRIANLATDSEDEEGVNAVAVGEFLEGVIVRLALPCAAAAFVLSYVIAAWIMPRTAGAAVRVCVLLSLLIAVGLCGSASYRYRRWWVYVISAVLVVFSLCYVCRAWRIIPFATANLRVAIRGMTENGGIYAIALLFSCLAFVWGVCWFYVANGVWELRVEGLRDACYVGRTNNGTAVDVFNETAIDEFRECVRDRFRAFWGIMFLLLVSLYWTTEVILNSVRVTVAGVMATWCFDKDDAASCCSPAVASSLCRSLTYSLGSICFGSLLEGVASAAARFARWGKRAADADGDRYDADSIVFGALACCTKCFDESVDFFNEWAYVYIGVYGHGYLRSGRRVMELFRSRGWTSIVSTFMVSYVLYFTSALVGVLTGLLGIALDGGKVGIEGYWDAFVVGFVVGFLIAHVMMNVIKGAVNTAIVCFADAPDSMARNHPSMTRDMAEAWVRVYPGCGVRVPSGMYDAVV